MPFGRLQGPLRGGFPCSGRDSCYTSTVSSTVRTLFCTDEGIRGKLFPVTASRLNDGTQFVVLTRAIRANSNNSATWGEVTLLTGR